MIVLAAVATLTVRQGESTAASDMALPVVRSQGAAPLHGTGTLSRAEQARRAQLTGMLAQALAADSGRPELPPLSDAARRSWEGVARPTQAATSAPGLAAPSAAPPEMPFEWVGLWEQPADKGASAQGPMAIIAGTHNTRIVKAGDLLEEDWKVDRISREQIELTYLPLHVRQTLNKK